MADQGSRLDSVASVEIQDIAGSKKFLQLLAKEINRGVNKYSYNNLQTYFSESVELLPNEKLKDALQKPDQTYIEYLWSLVNDEKRLSTVVELNLFNKNGIDETLRNVSELKSYQEQIHYLTEMALCVPCNQVFESLLRAQRKERPTNESEIVVLNKFIDLYGRLAIGCQNFEILNELMQTVLSEIDKINDRIKSSSSAKENWLDLKDVIHQFLIHCHMKQKAKIKESTLEDDVIQSKEWKLFQDILAAIIAIYIDVIIAIGQGYEEINNHISNIVYLLLGDSPSHILDMANQIFALESSTVKIIFPFLRKVFKTTKASSKKEFPNYVKFVCLARKVQQSALDDEMDRWYLKKNVCSLSPPKNFLSWLTDVDNSLIQDLELSCLAGQEITDKILFCKDEKIIDKLLDLASHPEKWNKINKSEDEHKPDEQGEIVENDSNDSLFFVDAQGSSELLQQCEDRQQVTNSKNKTMLKSQINTLLEKRDSIDSEDESYDFDISVEDNNEVTFNLNDNPGDNPGDNPDHNPDSNPDHNPDHNPEANPEANPDDMKQEVVESKDDNSFVEKVTPTQMRKKLRKRKSQTTSTILEKESKGKISSKKKTIKKRHSLSKTV